MRAFRRGWPGWRLAVQVGPFVEFYGRHRAWAAQALGLLPGRKRRGLGRGVGLHRRSPRLRHLLARGEDLRLIRVSQTERLHGAVRERRVTGVWLGGRQAEWLRTERKGET